MKNLIAFNVNKRKYEGEGFLVSLSLLRTGSRAARNFHVKHVQGWRQKDREEKRVYISNKHLTSNEIEKTSWNEKDYETMLREENYIYFTAPLLRHSLTDNWIRDHKKREKKIPRDTIILENLYNWNFEENKGLIKELLSIDDVDLFKALMQKHYKNQNIENIITKEIMQLHGMMLRNEPVLSLDIKNADEVKRELRNILRRKKKEKVFHFKDSYEGYVDPDEAKSYHEEMEFKKRNDYIHGYYGKERDNPKRDWWICEAKNNQRYYGKAFYNDDDIEESMCDFCNIRTTDIRMDYEGKSGIPKCIDKFKNLREIDIKGTLSTIPKLDLQKLEKLKITHTKLEEVTNEDISQFPKLKDLEVPGNNIQFIGKNVRSGEWNFQSNPIDLIGKSNSRIQAMSRGIRVV